MRRVICSLLLLLLATVPASAQTLGQGDVLFRTGTAVTVANTTTATTILTGTVPAFTYQNFAPQQYGATNLHIKALGTITTNPTAGCPGAGCVGTVNVGCNYGGATATITLANAAVYNAGLSAALLELDLWLRTSNTFAPLLSGRLMVPAASSAIANGGIPLNGPQILGAAVTGTTSVLSPQTISCSWLWSSASTNNSVTISSVVAVVGD